MNIVFDHHAFCLQRYGGISRYYCELASRLASREDVNVRVTAALHRNAPLARGTVPVSGRFVPAPQGWYAPLAAVDWLVSALTERARDTFTVVHETYYQTLASAPFGVPRVATVHDMTHEIFPQHFGRGDLTSWRKRRTVNRVDHVICVSHSTRRDLIERVGISPDRSSVVHHGWSLPAPEPPESLSLALGTPRPFVLFVGARGGYKNFDRLVAAWSASRRLRQDLALVCFGSEPFGRSELDAIRSRGLTDRDVWHVGGDDARLAAMYSRAIALVYPSLYEGFGLPPLEAMGHGCPVAASDRSSIPEVVGEAAVRFDPTDSEAIREAMERVVFDEPARAALIAAGRDRAALFSWDRCATETLAVYRSLA